MVRKFKNDNILGFVVKYIDAGYGMVFAQVPKITSQYMGSGKNKTETKRDVTRSIKLYLKHNK